MNAPDFADWILPCASKGPDGEIFLFDAVDWAHFEDGLARGLDDDQRASVGDAATNFLVRAKDGFPSISKYQSALEKRLNDIQKATAALTALVTPLKPRTYVHTPFATMSANGAVQAFLMDSKQMGIATLDQSLPALAQVCGDAVARLEQFRWAKVRADAGRQSGNAKVKGAQGQLELVFFIADLLATASRAGSDLTLPSHSYRSQDPYEVRTDTPTFRFVLRVIKCLGTHGQHAMDLIRVQEPEKHAYLKKLKRLVEKNEGAYLDQMYYARQLYEQGPRTANRGTR